MSLFSPHERRVADAFAQLIYCNPFLPIRMEVERALLGEAFQPGESVWSSVDLDPAERANVLRLQQIAESFVASARQRLLEGARPAPVEAQLYEEAVLYVLYYRHHAEFAEAITRSTPRRPHAAAELFKTLAGELRHLLVATGIRTITDAEAAHLMACFFQVRRAFHHIFTTLVGASLPIARLRAAIWQSIFTHDMRRYRRHLFDRTGDFATLVVGPSGTGKELVALAIGASRYIPFNVRRGMFAEDDGGSFFPLNLSALSPTLIESELFGHRRGAFTGALDDRQGWLEVCPPLGTVFLDEIGELDPAIQVKLLRVLQTRGFQRIGETQTLPFQGKIIAATNRDLATEIAQGRFRRDFYYRICSDIIVTPSLREQIEGSAQELRTLVRFIAMRMLPDECDALTDQTMANIDRHLGHDYAWPGNFRELEQCVRNVLIRGEYRPVSLEQGTDPVLAALQSGRLSADELLSLYCRQVYRQTGTYEAAARVLKLDRRTVRAKIASQEA